MNVATSPMDGAAAAMHRAFEAQRRAFLADMNPSRAVRLDRLARLGQAVESNEARFIEAISADFGGRPAQVAVS